MTNLRGDIAPPLPHNLEAERSILGAVLLDNQALTFARERLSPSDFFLEQNRKIYLSMLRLTEMSQPIDTLTLMDNLDARGELEGVGGVAYLSQLSDGIPRASNVEHYVRIVQREAIRRRFIHAAEHIRELAFATQDISAMADASRQLTTLGQESSAAPSTFHDRREYMNAPDLRFSIKNFVQLDAATIFGGLSGQAKTWILLSVAKAQLRGRGTMLWNHFPVEETAEKIIYLIPESTIGPFGHRLRTMGLVEYVANGRLLTRTLSKGPRLELDDPRILSAAKGAHVFLDTIGRWSEGDENSAGDNQRGLASDIFGLLGAGARSVVAAHHSPKGFSKESVMSLENCLRGSGDVGAMVGTAFGVRQIDPFQNVVHIECVKPRDFEPPQPFQLVGRPYIDSEGDFRMYRQPGECSRLEEYLQHKNQSGAPVQAREARAANIELLRTWLKNDPAQTSEALAERFRAAGIEVSAVTVRKYKSQISRHD